MGNEDSGTRQSAAAGVIPTEDDETRPDRQLQFASASEHIADSHSLVGCEIIADAAAGSACQSDEGEDYDKWEEGSRNTFGLPWECDPPDGGVVGSVHSRMEVSRITTSFPSVDPTVAMSSAGQQSRTDVDPVPGDVTARRGRRNKSSRGARNAMLLALAVVVILSVGLGLGLTTKNDDNSRLRSNTPSITPEGNTVTVATGKLCNAAEPFDDELFGPGGAADYTLRTRELDFPFRFLQRWTSLCTPEERVESRGSLQQAMIDKACDYDYRVWLGENENPDRFFGADEYRICLLPAGGVSGDIASGPVSTDQIDATQAASFRSSVSVQGSSSIFLIRVSGDDILRILSNAIEKAVTQLDTDTFGVGSAYPFASGLKYHVDLTREPGQKVFGLELLLRNENKWVSFDSVDQPSYLVMATAKALDDYGYVENITLIDKTTPGPLSLVDLVVSSLSDSSKWDPPTKDKMSTASFVGRGGKS